MSNELDLRIAKVKGWNFVSYPPYPHDTDSNVREWELHIPVSKMHPSGGAIGARTYQQLVDELPKWSSSLDLMHELEGELSEEERNLYIRWLDRACGLVLYCGEEYGAYYPIIHATAEEKAEAWLEVKEASNIGVMGEDTYVISTAGVIGSGTD